jgi:RNA polymerase sigma-70 factor (ECF subfamily)
VSEGARPSPTTPSSEHARPGVDADQEVVEALSRGETRRAIALCIRHAPSIGELCMAILGSQSEADELTLQTLLMAHQRFDDWRGDGSLRAWLLGIARHECVERLEKSRRRGAQRALVHAQSTGVHGPGESGRAVAARALLEHVRPSDREALLLRYGTELTLEEVAAVSGIDPAAARDRVSHALLRLRSVLESEYGDG